VLNLILNAEQSIRSTDMPGTISVRTGQAEGSAFLEISDDGPGVPPALANRIFEPFFTTKSVGEGTGLGLSVSFGIAEAHGGSLSLASTGHGACFTLKLPLTAAMEMNRSDVDVFIARPA
jgi:signal transduction histidine kinase